MTFKQKVKQKTIESLETLRMRSVESVKQNFTVLSREIIGQMTGQEIKSSPEKKQQNYTPFNENMREAMGEHFKNKEKPELDEVRRKLAEHVDENPQVAIKRQFELLRREEREAIGERKHHFIERKKKEEEEELQKTQQEEEKRKASMQTEEPQGKEQRGGLFARKKRRKQTIENKPAIGKQ